MKGCCRTETGVIGRGRFEKLGLAGDTKLSSNTLKAVLENSGGGMKGGGLRGVKWGPSCLSSGCGRVVLVLLISLLSDCNLSRAFGLACVTGLGRGSVYGCMSAFREEDEEELRFPLAPIGLDFMELELRTVLSLVL